MGRRDEDRRLASRMARRAAGALEEFQTAYTPLLRYIIAPILHDQRDQEECLADAIHRAWVSIERFNPNRGSLAAWLAAIARNAALNRLREQGRYPQWEPLDDHPHLSDPAQGPEEVLLTAELAQALRRAVDGLSPWDRNLFLRKYYYYQSTAQMAAELGLTVRGVEGRLYRIRKRLQKELRGDWHD
ncbi:MAG TPA: sigma-70 family RNA polymerase sigma factor [Candidatus Enterenecus stercoripullorum]|nr:sigma-70 family RNA polymerase sigma factor [Candidatus Enterenecus stercoripullorum]